MRRNRFRPSVTFPLTTLLLAAALLALAAPAHATFPGQNGKIVFTVSLGDSYSEFDLMNPDGRGKTRLTDLQGQNGSPTWSPDGSKIAFDTTTYSRFTPSSADRDIAVMNADGTGVTKLTDGDRNFGPVWSPDGSKIAFHRSDRIGNPNHPSYGPFNIAVINADGTGLTRLTNNNDRLTSYGGPAWSPDGSKIAFAGQDGIYVMNADGTGVTGLTNVAYAAYPNWSPDGSKIVFSGQDGIYVMNADGTGVTGLTNVAYAAYPNWSPDGSKIVFSGQDGIYVMNADGTGVTGPRDSGADPHPRWSPDGSKIAFQGSSWVLNASGVFTMNPDGSGQAFLGGPGAGDFDWQPLPAGSKNRAKKCKAEGKRGRQFGACTSPIISEFPVPHSFGVGDITAGPDRALWFTSGRQEIGSIGRITTSGTISEFPLPAPFGACLLSCWVNSITAGPDGALWFTSGGGGVGSIGRITTSGTITQFTIPTSPENPRIEPWAITAGSDGALWFTEVDSNRIGRVTTDGRFREFVIPSSPERAAIVAGPDGALWFTEGDANKIGRITTSGTISEFPTPTWYSKAITVGPDGALWFIGTVEDTSSIGRMTTSGDFTEFPLPSDLSPTADITTGPDGALWFTVPWGPWYPHANKIGRITTSGMISEFTLLEQPSPSSIAAGPDGALWFTERGANSIGRISTGPQRGDFKNASEFCNALRAFMGVTSFARSYPSFGHCVRQAH